MARLGALLKPHDIYVITSQAHVRPTAAQLPQLPEDNVLGEPLARSTAVAAGLATVLARRESDEVALVLPADHFVADEAAFAEALREAARDRGARLPRHAGRACRRTRRPGYGYIKAGKRLHPATPTALVERFVEKPDAKRAASFLEEGDHYWNAGIFVWRVYAFRQAVERFQPELGERAGADRGDPPHAGLDDRGPRHPGAVPAITIDVGIAEPAAAEGRMAVVPLNAGWSDIGSWSALLEALSGATGADLVACGKHLDRDSHRVLVHGGDRLDRDRRARGPDHRRHARRAPRLPPRPRRGDQAGPRRDRPHGRGALPLSSPRAAPLAGAAASGTPWRCTCASWPPPAASTGRPVNQDQVVLAFWHEYNLAAAIAALRLRRHRYHVSFSTQTFRGEVMSTMLAALDSGSVELPAEGRAVGGGSPDARARPPRSRGRHRWSSAPTARSVPTGARSPAR